MTGQAGSEVIFSRGGAELLELTIRPGRVEQAGQLYELSRPFMLSGVLPQHPAEFYADAAGDFWVVEHAGEVIACAGVSRSDAGAATLVNLVVEPSWQRLGVGRLLVAGVLRLLKGEQITELRVEPGPAHPWFTALGFTALGSEASACEGLSPTTLRRTTVAGFDELDALGEVADLQVRFARSGSRHRWDPSFSALLHFAGHHGVRVDSLCWGGVCGTCSVRIKHGTVSYDVAPEVDPQEGEVLMCVSRPMTDLVLDI
ncbi:GNAT family N-acetyltransferase [Kitasatospora mediocidica]|uniref:GNAT family N-acetyltransferase n=1 Tax=Kitasatospora mediocidica TaxID=58352 RepID=UPI000564BB99|nr:GNAT family N-acetyltransferase [Kitasatospora mediocidica]